MQIQIKLPFVKNFEDYHEIYNFGNKLSEITGVKIQTNDITPKNNPNIFNKHTGLFFYETKPTSKEIKKLLKF